MKRLIAALAFVCLAIPAQVFSQTPTMTPVYSTATAVWQIKPVAVPTMTTTVVSADAYLSTVNVSNPTSGAITFSLCDKQGSPVCVLPAVSIAPCTATGPPCVYVIVWPAFYWCPSGFTVLASGTGLTFYAGWRQ